MKTKYAVALALGIGLLFIAGVFAVDEIAKQKNVRFEEEVEINEDVYNEMNSKDSFNEKEIIEKGIQQVEEETLRDLAQEFEYQFYVMKNSRNYKGLRETIEFMKTQNQGKY